MFSQALADLGVKSRIVSMAGQFSQPMNEFGGVKSMVASMKNVADEVPEHLQMRGVLSGRGDVSKHRHTIARSTRHNDFLEENTCNFRAFSKLEAHTTPRKATTTATTATTTATATSPPPPLSSS